MPRSQIKFHDLSHVEQTFQDAVLGGFSRRAKAIPCQFLYDAAGSALFDEICRLPEYYLTRAELGILEANASLIAEKIGPGAQIIELGSGSSIKVKRLLHSLAEPNGYVPVDVSREHLLKAAGDLARNHPDIAVTAVCADYTTASWLPALGGLPYRRRVAFFAGSSIGNFEPDAAITLLKHIRRLVGRGGDLLIGVDLKKDAIALNAAYNDSAGVTAAFNLNLLNRINRELAGDFELDRFCHEAFYNEELGRIEIYIRSLADQLVNIAGRGFRLLAGERIHTEYSHKYSIQGFRALARSAGFGFLTTMVDDCGLFSVHHLRAT